MDALTRFRIQTLATRPSLTCGQSYTDGNKRQIPLNLSMHMDYLEGLNHLVILEGQNVINLGRRSKWHHSESITAFHQGPWPVFSLRDLSCHAVCVL